MCHVNYLNRAAFNIWRQSYEVFSIEQTDNIRLGWKSIKVTNASAYYTALSIEQHILDTNTGKQQS
jgi:hypothetical protein